jgi:hypothetical protein
MLDTFQIIYSSELLQHLCNSLTYSPQFLVPFGIYIIESRSPMTYITLTLNMRCARQRLSVTNITDALQAMIPRSHSPYA